MNSNIITGRGAVYWIGVRAEFTNSTNSFSGRHVTDAVSFGQLPNDYRAEYRRATEEPGAYVVFSYRTPIAWFTKDDGWTVPDVRYSPTTNKHQSFARQGISA